MKEKYIRCRRWSLQRTTPKVQKGPLATLKLVSGMALATPNEQHGIEYWNSQPADYNGVLGGFGEGSLPRVDSLGSRQFLLYLFPALSTVPSALRPLNLPSPLPRTRALDVGAGVGRVTSDVLLHLVSDVVLLEPVHHFITEALTRAKTSASSSPPPAPPRGQSLWKGLHDASKSVTFLQGTLQAFNPAHPLSTSTHLDRVGYSPSTEDSDSGFDVIWCQWCLGHLSDPDLVIFFRRCRAALRKDVLGKSLIVVKENLCRDGEDVPRTVFDEQDSSLTRSDLAWKALFKEAGLSLIKERVQEGLPPGLYVVKMYFLIFLLFKDPTKRVRTGMLCADNIQKMDTVYNPEILIYLPRSTPSLLILSPSAIKASPRLCLLRSVIMFLSFREGNDLRTTASS